MALINGQLHMQNLNEISQVIFSIPYAKIKNINSTELSNT